MVIKIHNRFIWATDILNVERSDNLLEIGCGNGVLAEMVARKLTTGRMIAIDKSGIMIKVASKRTDSAFRLERLRFLKGDLLSIRLPLTVYDKIFAFNVNLFAKNPEKELGVIQSLLKPGGLLYLFNQPPHETAEKLTEGTIKQLKQNRFEVIETMFE